MTDTTNRPAPLALPAPRQGKAWGFTPPAPRPPHAVRELRNSTMTTMELSLNRLWELMEWRRPQYSRTQRKFCKKYLAPVFGNPDDSGNYFLSIPSLAGEESPIMFTAHHDTVHTMGGKQKLGFQDTSLVLAREETQSNCMGADCTTGIWLILEMIAARVPGRYAIFAAEESGGHGSRDFVKSRPDDWKGCKAVISFDRKATGSIITHQSGGRSATDDFAESLADALGLSLKADTGGTFTDSANFTGVVGECTNLSVGYSGAHGKGEAQDMAFAWKLRNALIHARWSELRFSRKPGEREELEYEWDGIGYYSNGSFRSRFDSSFGGSYRRTPADTFRDAREFDFDEWRESRETILDIVQDNPDAIADLIESMGYDAKTLRRELAETLFTSRNSHRGK